MSDDDPYRPRWHERELYAIIDLFSVHGLKTLVIALMMVVAFVTVASYGIYGHAPQCIVGWEQGAHGKRELVLLRADQIDPDCG